MTDNVMPLDPERSPKGATLQDYVRDIYEEFRTSAYRDRKLKEIEAGRKAYREDIPAKNFPWEGCSNKSVGLTAIAVDGLEPRIWAQLIGDKTEFVQVEPVGPEDVQMAQAAKEFMNWALISNMKISEHSKPIIHDLLMDGTKDLIPIWDEEEVVNRRREMRPVFVRMDGERVDLPEAALNNPQAMMQLGAYGIRQAGMEEVVTETTDVRFKVKLEAVNLHDAFFPDAGPENGAWWDQPYLRYIYPTYETLEKLQDDGVYHDIGADMLRSGRRSDNDDYDEDAADKGVETSMYTDEVRLLEAYVSWQGEWVLATYNVDGDFREVRRQPMSEVYWHGRKPVHRWRIFPESNESMGTGIPQKIRYYSDGIDDIFNIMIDGGTIENLPWGFVQEGPGAATMDLEIAVGKMLPVPRGSQVFFPPQAAKSLNWIAVIELILAFFERKIQLMDGTLSGKMGRAGGGTETYSGMALLVQEGNIGHQYKGETLRDLFANLIKDIQLLYAQNLPMSAKMRVWQANEWVFKPIDVMTVQGQYDYRVEVSDSSANKMLNRKEKMELYQVLGNNPIVALPKLVTGLVESYGEKNLEEWIRPEITMLMRAVMEAPEIVQIVQQYMQQRGAQQQDRQTAQEAQANLRRQQIERQVESEAGLEDQKIMDQLRESVKRRAAQAAMGIGGGQ